MQPEWAKVYDCAIELNLTQRSVYERVKKGHLPAVVFEDVIWVDMNVARQIRWQRYQTRERIPVVDRLPGT